MFNIVSNNNTTFEGNIGYGPTGTGGTFTTGQLQVTNPLLNDAGSIYKIASNSPAVNSSVGAYSFVTTDNEGQSRSSNDIGADEYSSGSITKAPLTINDVGCYAP